MSYSQRCQACNPSDPPLLPSPPTQSFDTSTVKLDIEHGYECSWGITVTWPCPDTETLGRYRALLVFEYDHNEFGLRITLNEYFLEFRESVRHRRYEPRTAWHRNPRVRSHYNKTVDFMTSAPSLPLQVQDMIKDRVVDLIKTRYA